MTTEPRTRREDQQSPAPWTPIPDPTALTNALVAALKAEMREELRAAIESASAVTAEKFNGVGIRVDSIENGIRDRLIERDRRAQAIMHAADEAMRKSEAQFEKRIESLERQGDNNKDLLSTRINDLSSRIDRGDGNQLGRTAATSSTRENVAMFVGIAGVLVALFVGAAAFIGSRASTDARIDALSRRMDVPAVVPK